MEVTVADAPTGMWLNHVNFSIGDGFVFKNNVFVVLDVEPLESLRCLNLSRRQGCTFLENCQRVTKIKRMKVFVE